MVLEQSEEYRLQHAEAGGNMGDHPCNGANQENTENRRVEEAFR